MLDVRIGSLDELLRPYEVPWSPRKALHYLDGRLEDLGILICYAHFFPQEWARSTAPRTRAAGDYYSAAEEEFFVLVNRDLFPLVEYWQDDESTPDARELLIPVDCFALARPNADPVCWPEGYRILGVLLGEWDPRATDLDPAQTAALRALEAQHEATAARWIAYDALLALGRVDGGPPWDLLPQARAIVEHNTGNEWIDYDEYMEGPDLPWEIRVVESLAAEFVAAKALLPTVRPLIDYIETHFEEVLTAWTHALPSPLPTATP